MTLEFPQTLSKKGIGSPPYLSPARLPLTFRYVPFAIARTTIVYSTGGHFFRSDSPTPWQDAWRELEKLYSAGAVRAIGVSNFSEGLLRELLVLATVVPAAVQNWMDPFHQDKAVRALCAEHGESAAGVASETLASAV